MKRTPNHQQNMSTKPSLIFFAAAAGVEPALMRGLYTFAVLFLISRL